MVLAAEWAFRALFTGNFILLGRQLFPPLSIAFDDFVQKCFLLTIPSITLWS
jgi:hypothetical protein